MDGLDDECLSGGVSLGEDDSDGVAQKKEVVVNDSNGDYPAEVAFHASHPRASTPSDFCA